MNKAIKRALAGGMSLMLLTAPALAEDASLRTVATAAETLMLGTDNVTMHLDAGFSWDGKEFKRLALDMAQEGATSYQKVAVTTVGDKETVGGYVVYGENGRAYAVTKDSPYYDECSTQLKQSLARNTKARTTVMNVLRELAPSLDGHVTTAANGESTDWTLTLQAGETPALTDTMLSFVTATLLQSKGYPNDEMGMGGYVEYQDMDATLLSWAMVNAPDDVAAVKAVQESTATDSMYELYSTLYDRMYSAYQEKLYAGGIDGVLYVRSDSRCQWYEDYNAMLRGEGIVRVSYESYDQAIMAYYAKLVAKDVTEDQYYNAMNDMSAEDYLAFFHGAEDYYRTLAGDVPGMVAVYVRKDGTVQAYDDYQLLMRNNLTLIQQILNGFTALKINSCTVNATTDGSDRLTKAEGTLSLTIVDRESVEHTLDVTLSLTAGDYGTTACPRFDVKQLGLMSQEEYWQNQ